jgi:hypothetical protein
MPKVVDVARVTVKHGAVWSTCESCGVLAAMPPEITICELCQTSAPVVAAAERPAEPGELCTCGRPAVTVFLTGRFGPVGYCGVSDGGARSGDCPFCGEPRSTHDERCPRYVLRPGGEQS